MRFAIDAREAFAARKAGKAVWTDGFLRELLTRGLDVAVLVDDRAPEGTFVRFPDGARFHLEAARYVTKEKFDVYISPTSFIVPYLLPTSVKSVPVIHDLAVYRPEPHEWKAARLEKLLLPRILRKASHICTVSQSTKDDLVRMFPDIDPSSVSPVFAGPMHESVSLSHPDGKTILCVGTLCPRKNQLRLIAAFASLPVELRSQYRLVLAGSRGWHDIRIIRYAENTKGVEWRNFVSEKEYDELLSTATVFAYPSLYEGFGMQVLDALQRGIPVLTSDRGSLAEVTGSAAVIVDPESELSIASGLIALLQNDDVRQTLRDRGPKQAARFSWKYTVDLFLESLEKAV